MSPDEVQDYSEEGNDRFPAVLDQSNNKLNHALQIAENARMLGGKNNCGKWLISVLEW